MRRALVLCMLGVVLFGVFAAHNVYAENADIAQRIIGTWVDNKGSLWVFNAKRTGTDGTDQFRYVVTDTLLALVRRGSREVALYDISLTADGRTLILGARSGSGGYWLTKR